MGLKSIELQVAIPRSQDAGKMQEQMMRQGQQFQETLTEQQLKEEIVKRGKINEYEQVRNNDDPDDNKKEQNNHQRQKKKKEEKQSIEHPYLGTKIDYSG